MKNMSISLNYFKSFVEKENDLLSGQRINKIIQITRYDYYFFLIPSKKIMHISFNPANPFILLEDNFYYTKLETTQNLQNLKKHLNDAKILNISLENDDKIIAFKFRKTYENYEVNEGKLVIEFITSHPNLLILDSNDKVIYALHYTSIESTRFVTQNIPYEFPKKGNKANIEVDSNKDTLLINSYNENLISMVKKDQYSKLIKKVNSSIKSLKKKITILEDVLEESSHYENYKLAGDYIYEYYDEDFDSFIVNARKFELNPTLSKIENANYFYKKYKKFKEGYSINQKFFDKAKNDLYYFENLSFQISQANLEDMEEIKSELEQNGLIKPEYKSCKKQSAIKPYFVKINNTNIYFGKNNSQNDALTFNLSKKDYYFLHVKDYHGSHVVIFDNNPDEKIIQKACEIALFLSKMSSGDVMLADIKDVKKTSSKGLVNVLKYQTIHISNYNNEEIQKLIEGAQR